MVKMIDVARAANVSPMTVSRAFRTDASIDAKTRAKVLKAAEELGYVFNEQASNLRSKRSGFVAVTVPTINNPNFAETVDQLSLHLSQSGLQVLLGYDRYNMAEEELRVEQLLRRKPEAMVVTGGRHSDRTRSLLQASGIPIVETWDLPQEPLGHVVGFSNEQAMGLVVAHLADRGARRIAFIGGDFSPDTRGAERRRGYVQAMETHGLSPDILVPIGGPTSVASGATAMAHLLDTYRDLDAVACVFDYAAFGALTECQRRGVDVPRDIMLASFGATDVATLACPSITTIDPHSAKIGRLAGRLITDLITDQNPTAQPVRIEVEPILRPGLST